MHRRTPPGSRNRLAVQHRKHSFRRARVLLHRRPTAAHFRFRSRRRDARRRRRVRRLGSGSDRVGSAADVPTNGRVRRPAMPAGAAPEVSDAAGRPTAAELDPRRSVRQRRVSHRCSYDRRPRRGATSARRPAGGVPAGQQTERRAGPPSFRRNRRVDSSSRFRSLRGAAGERRKPLTSSHETMTSSILA